MRTPPRRSPDAALNRRPGMLGICDNFFAEPRMTCSKGNPTMLRLAAAFLSLALLAAVFGFGAGSGFSWGWARLLFFIFTALTVLCFLGGAYRWRAYLN